VLQGWPFVARQAGPVTTSHVPAGDTTNRDTTLGQPQDPRAENSALTNVSQTNASSPCLVGLLSRVQ